MKAHKRKREKVLAVSIITFWMWGTGIILGGSENLPQISHSLRVAPMNEALSPTREIDRMM